MEAGRQNFSVTHSPCRSFKRNDVTWIVRETDAHDVPGAQGIACLVFDSREMMRRVWIFPRNWHRLNENELWALSERSGRISAKCELRNRDLSSELFAHLVSMSHAQAVHARAKAAMAGNWTARAERRLLIESCRFERTRMREMVETHAADLRIAGLTAEDASLFVASAVRETVVQLGTNTDSALRLENDTSRWCANAYRAA
jgi:hypothetical protein